MSFFSMTTKKKVEYYRNLFLRMKKTIVFFFIRDKLYLFSLAIIEMIWSPHISIFSKKSSLKVLTDLQFDMYERCSTFDGPEHFCKTLACHEKNITDEIKNIANSISYKVKNISYDMFVINRSVLYFKRDKNKNMYFLFATSSRTQNSKTSVNIFRIF